MSFRHRRAPPLLRPRVEHFLHVHRHCWLHTHFRTFLKASNVHQVIMGPTEAEAESESESVTIGMPGKRESGFGG